VRPQFVVFTPDYIAAVLW